MKDRCKNGFGDTVKSFLEDVIFAFFLHNKIRLAAFNSANSGKTFQEFKGVTEVF